MTARSIRSRLATSRPDLAPATPDEALKRKLALALRALRKGSGLTQKQVEAQSDLTQPAISRLESPSGPLPNWGTVMRYVAACDGHMLFGLSATAFDEASFLSSRAASGSPATAAVAM